MSHTPRSAALVSRTLGLLGLLAIAPCAWGQNYNITELGNLGGSFTVPTAMNASGEGTGTGYLPGDTIGHAFLYNGSNLIDLGTLGGSGSRGLFINASGEVAGDSTTASGATHAFLYNGSSLVDLGALGGPSSNSNAEAINASGEVSGVSGNDIFLYNGSQLVDVGSFGQVTNVAGMNDGGEVVGFSGSNGSTAHAVLYNGANLIDLGTLTGSGHSNAAAINDAGQVTGTSTATHGSHAFLYSNGSMSDLGTLGGIASVGQVINSSGEVAGWSDTASGRADAFLYDGTSMHDISSHLSATTPDIESINDKGDAVGFFSIFGQSFPDAPFLYLRGTAYNLNSLLPANSGIQLEIADSINDAGQIYALGFDSNKDVYTGFILTPSRVPETASAMELLCGALALLALATRAMGWSKATSCARL